MIFDKVARHALSIQSKNSTISFKYLQKEGNDQVYFLLADKYQCFVKVYTKSWVCVARHNQNTQDNKLISFLSFVLQHGA